MGREALEGLCFLTSLPLASTGQREGGRLSCINKRIISHPVIICSFQGVSDMGPAVFNGGFSTFLAFALLMTSKSFVFVTFFKIFFLVVGFGLYHGLVFLPVILRYIIQCGPTGFYT